MFKQKKGISPLIAWVLLIGFAVSLAGMVGFWMKSYARDAADKLIVDKEEDVRCSDVAFNVNLNCTVTPEQITLANTGKFSIMKLRVRQSGAANNDLDLQGLLPQTSKTETLNSFDATKTVDFIPVIAIEGKEVLCTSRMITTTC